MDCLGKFPLFRWKLKETCGNSSVSVLYDSESDSLGIYRRLFITMAQSSLRYRG